jgi:Mor family transcriptional regulator
MGKPSEEETERNEKLFKEWTSKKYSIVELVTKYQISTARIYQIIKRAKRNQG